MTVSMEIMSVYCSVEGTSSIKSMSGMLCIMLAPPAGNSLRVDRKSVPRLPLLIGCQNRGEGTIVYVDSGCKNISLIPMHAGLVSKLKGSLVYSTSMTLLSVNSERRSDTLSVYVTARKIIRS